MTIMAPADAPDVDPQTRDVVANLQRLLAEAIRGRADARNRLFELYDEPVVLPMDRHWFVDNGEGYCAACNLPEANARHAPRAAV